MNCLVTLMFWRSCLRKASVIVGMHRIVSPNQSFFRPLPERPDPIMVMWNGPCEFPADVPVNCEHYNAPQTQPNAGALRATTEAPPNTDEKRRLEQDYLRVGGQIFELRRELGDSYKVWIDRNPGLVALWTDANHEKLRSAPPGVLSKAVHRKWITEAEAAAKH